MHIRSLFTLVVPDMAEIHLMWRHMQKYSFEHKKYVAITVSIEVIREGSNSWGRTWSFITIFVFWDFSSKLSLWNSVDNIRFILAVPDYVWASLTVAQGAELKRHQTNLVPCEIFSVCSLLTTRGSNVNSVAVCICSFVVFFATSIYDVWNICYTSAVTCSYEITFCKYSGLNLDKTCTRECHNCLRLTVPFDTRFL